MGQGRCSCTSLSLLDSTFPKANLIARQETIGQATGSEAWRSSGADEKAAGIKEMKDAGEARKAASADGHPGYGKTEELAGKIVGCEGMENEGKDSERK